MHIHPLYPVSHLDRISSTDLPKLFHSEGNCILIISRITVGADGGGDCAKSPLATFAATWDGSRPGYGSPLANISLKIS